MRLRSTLRRTASAARRLKPARLAETLIHSTKNFLAENSDNLPADMTAEAYAAIADLQKTLDGSGSRGDGRSRSRPITGDDFGLAIKLPGYRPVKAFGVTYYPC